MGSPRFNFIKGDLREAGSWTEGFKGAHAIFHMATNPEVIHSVREPLDHYHQNVTVH